MQNRSKCKLSKLDWQKRLSLSHKSIFYKLVQFNCCLFYYIFLVLIGEVFLRYLYLDIFRTYNLTCQNIINSCCKLPFSYDDLISSKTDQLGWVQSGWQFCGHFVYYLRIKSAKQTIQYVILSIFLKIFKISIEILFPQPQQNTFLGSDCDFCPKTASQ